MSDEEEDDNEFEHITTDVAVAAYKASQPIFAGVLKEVRVLSAKKPEATMSAGKVKLINRILNDLFSILKGEPESKYLEALDEDKLPQVSDAVLAMVQFETALASFELRYFKYVQGNRYWITTELLDTWRRDTEDS